MKIKPLLTIVLAVVVGEIALVLLTTLAQEVLFDGISYHHSGLFTLVFGGLATFLAALLAGALARWVSGTYSVYVPAAISMIIVVEMSYLISARITGDPVWFDVLAGLSLIIGIWLGYSYHRWWPNALKMARS